MRRHIAYRTFFIGVLIFTCFEELGIRPYLIKNNIPAFYLADSLPNFLAVVLLSSWAMTWFVYKDNKKIIKLSATFTFSIILYEFCQVFMPGRGFDLIDLLASVAGGLFAYLTFSLINRKFSDTGSTFRTKPKIDLNH